MIQISPTLGIARMIRLVKLMVSDSCLNVNRLHLLELGVGAFLFFCGCYDVAFGRNHYFIYLYVQAIAFFIVGFGYVGTFVPKS